MRPVLHFFLFVLIVGCDTIGRHDYQIDYLPPVPEGADVRRILLEDYTGVRCSNCPQAAAKAAQLGESYGDRLVVVAIHAGYFARPLDKHDFRTEAGTAYNDYFKVKGNPQGIVNRLPYQHASFYPIDQWIGAVEALPLRSPLGLVVEPEYDMATRSYRVVVKINSFRLEGLPSSAHLQLWLVEDRIIASQMLEDGKTIDPTYLHRHLFRQALNGTWGESIADFPPALGSSLTLVREGYTLPATYNEANCTVVGLLTDDATKEVYQVTESALIGKPI